MITPSLHVSMAATSAERAVQWSGSACKLSQMLRYFQACLMLSVMQAQRFRSEPERKWSLTRSRSLNPLQSSVCVGQQHRKQSPWWKVKLSINISVWTPLFLSSSSLRETGNSYYLAFSTNNPLHVSLISLSLKMNTGPTTKAPLHKAS